LPIVVGPPVLGVAFVTLFLWIQRTFDPAGSLEGIDMTPYAHRDMAFVIGFGVLLLYVTVCTWRPRGAAARVVVFMTGGCDGLAHVPLDVLRTPRALIVPAAVIVTSMGVTFGPSIHSPAPTNDVFAPTCSETGHAKT
jgi:hypothetical protein